MMKKIRYLSITLLTILASMIFVPVAFAHPLGNFTINQFVGLNISNDSIQLDYVVDMAEIPAFQEIAEFDSDGNGQPDSSEFSGYSDEKCASLQPSLGLLVNKKPLTLTLISSTVEFPKGVSGLPTLRLTCQFQTSTNLVGDRIILSFDNNAFPERIGWIEIVVIPNDVSLQGDYSITSLSNRLTSYPQDLLTSPLKQRQLNVEILAGVTQTQNTDLSVSKPINSSPLNQNDTFTNLILLDEINFPTLLFALAVSSVWGAMHALTPGHGKTIVGAYLVGSRGTIKHAVYLGLTTTITHTLGVFALGLVTLFAAKYILPETLFPWMSLLSGLFVVGIGVNLAWSRFRFSELGGKLETFRANLTRSSEMPAPVLQNISAIQIDHQHQYVLGSGHGHSHSHHHDHDNHSHDQGRHEHNHSHADHSHMPPGADGMPVTWRSLLALGISGGIIPCPSALVVLLGAISLNKIGLGLVLVLAFSFGLAGALTAIGMAFIYAGRVFNRFQVQGRVVQLLPVLSALIVSGIGIGILIKAMIEIGWL
jgi:ABC-type nickel/cobalt efflux system permease component RcnA